MQKTGQRKQLETYGQQGHLGGWITDHIRGKTVDMLLKDGVWLIIRTTDGHEFRIGWQDSGGNQLRGEPFLENLDCTIVLPGVQIGGRAENL